MGFSKEKFANDINLKGSEDNNLNQNLFLKQNSKHLNKLLNNAIIILAGNLEKIEKTKNIIPDSAELFSDTQFSNEEYTIAEGEVSVKYKNMTLKADKLKYYRKTKVLVIKGNIYFESNDQFIKASLIKYDLINKKGSIENPYGSINFETLKYIGSEENSENYTDQFQKQDSSIRNVKLHKSSSIKIDKFNLDTDNNEDSFFEERLPQKIDVKTNEMKKWRFISKKIEINNELWTADKLYITNDPFNKPQLVINNTNFSSLNKNGEVLVKSKWSTLVLDDFLKIPTGPKTYSSAEDNNSRWGLGYDESERDGLFISRNSDPIFFGKDKNSLEFRQFFLVQRALSGKTKNYSRKNDSVLDRKIEQDTKVLDYIGLEAELNSKLLDFDFYSNVKLSSLDFEKLKKIISSKNELSKIIYQDKKNNMQKETIFSIFGNYRDKVWNGSLGEIEILSSYGTKIEKKNLWKDNNVKKSSKIGLGYGNYKSGKLNDSTVAIDRKRLNLSLERNHTYPIWSPEVDQFITNQNKYSPSAIEYGIKLLVQTKADFYRYDDDNYQDLYTFRAGPQFIFGQFKNNFLDYTKIEVLPKATINSGQSPFKFDQANDKHGIEFSLEQQIIGPITFKLSTEYNLDVNSENYKEFYKNKYTIAMNRRAYNLSLYYKEDEKTGGITFKIHNFNFSGIGETFK